MTIRRPISGCIGEPGKEECSNRSKNGLKGPKGRVHTAHDAVPRYYSSRDGRQKFHLKLTLSLTLNPTSLPGCRRRRSMHRLAYRPCVGHRIPRSLSNATRFNTTQAEDIVGAPPEAPSPPAAQSRIASSWGDIVIRRFIYYSVSLLD